MTWCGQTIRTNQIVNKWISEVQISCIKKIIGHSPEWLMPCTCILVCTCSRVQVTPIDIPNKQICTPVMFLVCVVCSCTNGIEMPYPNYFLSYYPKLWSGFVDICTERFWIQCPTVLLISHFHLKMWVMSFLQSNSFEKKQVSTSLHLQSATPD